MGSAWGMDHWLWLYGATWIFGFNTRADHDRVPIVKKQVVETPLPSLSLSKPRPTKKRKRGEGAGDAIPQREMGGLIYLDEPKEPLRSKVNPADRMEFDETSEDSDQDMADVEADNQEQDVKNEAADGDVGSVARKEKQEAVKWFLTHKYRPILGMAPIDKPSTKAMPQMILVERPIWDLDLPARYESAHE